MVDDVPPLQPASAIAGRPLLAKPDRAGVTEAVPACRFSYRGPASLVASAFGTGGGEHPLRAETAGARASLWLGPDERLLIAPSGEAPAIVAAFAANRATPHALVDISHRNVAVIVEGPAAARLLNAACPLDLDPAAFPVGMCTRTIFGKAEIVLWRTAANRFHVEAWRSFMPYVVDLLAEAGRDA